MAKNYYLILGITEDASREDIRAAFRRRALELHPDRSGMESGPFQAVQEAYSVLGDPERRRCYDRERPRPVAMSRQRGRRAEPVVPERPPAEPFRPVEPARRFHEMSLAESFETYRPSFEELFERLWSNFEGVNRPKSEHLESLTVETVVRPEEAQWGGQVPSAITRSPTFNVHPLLPHSALSTSHSAFALNPRFDSHRRTARASQCRPSFSVFGSRICTLRAFFFPAK